MKGFIAIVKKYKLAMGMNFIGLVLAFTAFMALMVQVNYQHEFDRHYPAAGRIYRVDKAGMDRTEAFCNVLPRGYADDIIGSSPHIMAGSISCPYVGEVVFYARQDEQSEPVAIKHSVDVVYPGFFEIFGAEFVEGSADALDDLSKIAIPHSLAKRLFGNGSAIGRTFSHNEMFKFGTFRSKDLTVGAVYEDFPENSQVNNFIYMNIGSVQQGSYGGANYVCWLLLDSSDNKAEVEDNFNRNHDYGDENRNWLTDIELTPIEDIYFETGNGTWKSGSKKQMWLMICISILVMLIGSINYATFFTSLAPARVRSVNTQKILGSSTQSLRLTLIAEAMVFSLMALVIALCIISPVTDWLKTEGITSMAFDFGRHIPLTVLMVSIALLLGIVAGAYPSFYVTSLPTAFALKGNFALSSAGRRFRRTMMILQFCISFVLLIFVLTAQRQNRFMMEYDSGFEKDGLFVTEISQTHAAEKADWLKERLCARPEVADVAFAMETVGGQESYSITTLNLDGQDVMTFVIYCSYNFLDVMEIPVIEGRNFVKSDGYNGKTIMNQALKNAGGRTSYNQQVGEIVGLTGHVRINSLRDTAVPTCYSVFPMEYIPMTCMYIRLSEGVDAADARDEVMGVLKEMDPAYPFDLKIYDEITGDLYSNEIRQEKTVTLFSILAVMLSLIGIFGQVLLDVQQRRREISIQKVYGAEVGMLLKEGMMRYSIPVAVAFVIAAPVAYYTVNRWMEGFVERVGISVWTFAVAFFGVMALTLAIVAFQYISAARTNPAEALKTE